MLTSSKKRFFLQTSVKSNKLNKMHTPLNLPRQLSLSSPILRTPSSTSSKESKVLGLSEFVCGTDKGNNDKVVAKSKKASSFLQLQPSSDSDDEQDGSFYVSLPKQSSRADLCLYA